MHQSKIDQRLPVAARYVRKCKLLDNGKYIIHCQFQQQSHMIYQASVLYIDKTFKRSKTCNEIEFNAYNTAQQGTTTLARIYTNLDDAHAYEHVFRMVFDQVEQDNENTVHFAPLQPANSRAPAVKGIMVDMHRGQAKGLQNYFNKLINYKQYGGSTVPFVLSSIVKVCRVHYQRTITGERNSLRTKAVNDSMISSSVYEYIY